MTAQVARLVDDLLALAGSLRVLATCRSPVGGTAETVYPLAPLRRGLPATTARCDSSSTGPGRRRRPRRSATATRTCWCGSAAVSTACRWRSSWRPPASGTSRCPSSRVGSTTGSRRWAAPGRPDAGTARSRAPSSGPGTCSTATSSPCCVAWPPCPGRSTWPWRRQSSALGTAGVVLRLLDRSLAVAGREAQQPHPVPAARVVARVRSRAHRPRDRAGGPAGPRPLLRVPSLRVPRPCPQRRQQVSCGAGQAPVPRDQRRARLGAAGAPGPRPVTGPHPLGRRRAVRAGHRQPSVDRPHRTRPGRPCGRVSRGPARPGCRAVLRRPGPRRRAGCTLARAGGTGTDASAAGTPPRRAGRRLPARCRDGTGAPRGRGAAGRRAPGHVAARSMRVRSRASPCGTSAGSTRRWRPSSRRCTRSRSPGTRCT